MIIMITNITKKKMIIDGYDDKDDNGYGEKVTKLRDLTQRRK